MAQPVLSKTCTGCKQDKPLTEYYQAKPGRLKTRCKACVLAQQKPMAAARSAEYRAANPGKNKERCRAYRAAHLPQEIAYNKARWADPETRSKDQASARRFKAENPQHVAARQRRYERARSTQRKAYIAQYAKAHPDRYRAYQATRRARLAGAEGSHTAEDIADIRRMQSDRCACCQTSLNGRGAADHIVSLARNGTNWRTNLQLLCKPCNSAKRDKDPVTFMRERGLLL